MDTIFTFQSLQITKDTQKGWLIKTNDLKTIFKSIASLEIDSLRSSFKDQLSNDYSV